MQDKIKVLIIDDSAVMRKVLTEILSADKKIEVVGAAADPYIAREKIKQLNPDVLTLDVEMPKMDGISFLKNLMRLRPMPVVMISSLTEAGADIALEALDLGAFDYVSKPKLDVAQKIQDYSKEITDKVKAAAKANIRPAAISSGSEHNAGTTRIKPSSGFATTEKIITIGASTGGTEAIKEILVQLPADSPGIIITQHIPAAFSGAFAKRIDSLSKMAVCEAVDKQPVLRGHAYIAPGDKHLKLARSGTQYYCQLDDGEPVNRHKPSVDVMFNSVASVAGQNALGVILTGMGADGSLGLKAMRDAGSVTVAQDKASSVVWGMPGEAVKLDAAQHILPINTIADKLISLLERS